MDGLGLYWFLLAVIGGCYLLVKSEARRKEREEVSKAQVKPSVTQRSATKSQTISSPGFQLVNSSGEVLDITVEERVSSGDPLEDDYQSWLSILSEKNPHLSEFQLYGTKAAVIRGEKGMEDVVQVLCITSFSKGIPVTKKYEYYQFDIAGWYWSYATPRGSAGEVKSYIKSLGLPRAKEKATD